MTILDLPGSHGSDVRPARAAAGRKPWAKDPTGPGADNGTRLDATLVNDLLALIRAVITAANANPAPGEDSALANAIIALVAANSAGLHSPEFTGTPTAPTADPGTANEQIATTAFVADSFAPKESPELTGTPTAPTASPGTNTQQIATTAFVAAAIAALVNSAPGALDTLNELAEALGEDPDFATTITNALAGKQDSLGFTPPPDTRTISAGTGLTGGGNLTANRTISASIASQAQAEAGTATNVLMTPQRVAQAIAALVPEGSLPTAADVAVTPAGGIASTNVQAALQELDSEKAAASHTHSIANVTGLQSALDGKASSSHTHNIADVTGLQTALDAKQASLGFTPPPNTRSVATSGLATGGGNLTADRTITVPKASGSDLRTGTDDTKALTTKAAYDAVAYVALTQASTIAVNFAAGRNFSTTMTGNRTLGNPTNKIAGQTGVMEFIQDATGNRTLAYASDWRFAGDEAPALSTEAGKKDVLSYIVLSDLTVWATLAKDVP